VLTADRAGSRRAAAYDELVVGPALSAYLD